MAILFYLMVKRYEFAKFDASVAIHISFHVTGQFDLQALAEVIPKCHKLSSWRVTHCLKSGNTFSWEQKLVKQELLRQFVSVRRKTSIAIIRLVNNSVFSSDISGQCAEIEIKVSANFLPHPTEAPVDLATKILFDAFDGFAKIAPEAANKSYHDIRDGRFRTLLADDIQKTTIHSITLKRD